MNISIAEYNKELSPEAKEEVLHRNFETTRKGFEGISTSTLVNYTHKTLRNITSTSYVDVADLAFSFEASGGEVEIDFTVSVATSGAIQGDLQMVLDGLVVDMASYLNLAGAGVDRISLSHTERLIPGTHQVKLQAKVSAGTLGVSNSTLWSLFTVKETRA